MKSKIKELSDKFLASKQAKTVAAVTATSFLMGTGLIGAGIVGLSAFYFTIEK